MFVFGVCVEGGLQRGERKRERERERTLSVVVGSAKNWLYNQFMFVAVITFPFIKKTSFVSKSPQGRFTFGNNTSYNYLQVS